MMTRAKLDWRLMLLILIAAPMLGICRTQVQLRAQSSKDEGKAAVSAPRKLSHEETLQWIAENKAWRLAKKTKPIWCTPVETDEVGKEFQTADHVKEKAKAGFWLCVGVAGEPWFQAPRQARGQVRTGRERNQDLRLRYETARLQKVQTQGNGPELGSSGQGTWHRGIFRSPGIRPGTAALLTGWGLRR